MTAAAIKSRIRAAAPAAGLVVFILAFWQFFVTWREVPRWLLPSPLDIAAAFVDSADLMGYHIPVTLLVMAAGFTISLLLGTTVATVCHLFGPVRRAVYPLLVTSQSVPFIIIAPLLVIWFGFGLAPKLVLVTLVCAFPITVTFLEGLRSADHEALDLLRSMGASRWDQFRLVQLPPALAALAAGAKIAATYAVIGALIAEWLGASRGLGVFLIRSMNSFRADRALAAIVIVILIALTAWATIELLTRWAMPWRAHL
ncbi:MAG: ABC transporter permease [Chloroflexi bacterium]|nr:ABC transporter permease [Chloroflexota bacterium]MDE2702497.1 ABC transporter permease [Chloroflexota bacterium]MDE2863022.1 ABC transporter permease [Chloroflexota bacterium]MDE2937225.1 ABC transporter permease [Chloroflexota bacterium]MXX66160.1 ABC transporter permease [Chloroflexota bacterium]